MKSYSDNLRELRKRKVYAKISGLARKAGQAGTPATAQPDFEPAVYRPMLDFIHDIFGEDYVVYAGRNRAALEIMREYFTGKGQSAAEKFFWRNSVPAYKWERRDSRQPQSS